MFDTQQAHSILVSIMNQRKARAGKVLRYKLHYTNRLGEIDGIVQGYTRKELKNEFKKFGGRYRYAFITSMSGDKVYDALDTSLSSKWVNYARSIKKQ